MRPTASPRTIARAEARRRKRQREGKPAAVGERQNPALVPPFKDEEVEVFFLSPSGAGGSFDAGRITAVNIAKKEWTVQYKDGQCLVHDLSKEEVWRYPVKEGAAARRRAAHQATQQLQQMSAAGVVASEVAARVQLNRARADEQRAWAAQLVPPVHIIESKCAAIGYALKEGVVLFAVEGARQRTLEEVEVAVEQWAEPRARPKNMTTIRFIRRELPFRVALRREVRLPTHLPCHLSPPTFYTTQ